MKHDDGVNRLFSLDEKIAILTGATGHFGRVFAHALCDAGATLLLVARNNAPLRELKQELAENGHDKVLTHPLDLRVDSDLQAFAEHVLAAHGKLDILVHNAYSGQPGTEENATAEDFRAAYDVTVTAAFRLVQLLQPALRRAADGEGHGASVINIASMYGIVSPDPRIYGDSGSNNPPYYGSAKAGLIQLTRYLACHLASAGIRVNSISPGPFPPPEIAQKAPAFYAELCRKIPLGRTGQPEELIGALLFLASRASSYVTGANLRVDGGWTAW